MKEYGSAFAYEVLPDPPPAAAAAAAACGRALVPACPPSPTSSPARLSAECAREGRADQQLGDAPPAAVPPPAGAAVAASGIY